MASLALALAACLCVTSGPLQAEQGAELPGDRRTAMQCGVEAILGIAQILGADIDRPTIARLVATYEESGMTLLDVKWEIQGLTGIAMAPLSASYEELLWLDRPMILYVHEPGCGCEPDDQGHAIAVERLDGDWAIVADSRGVQLQSSEDLRSRYGGYALVAWAATEPLEQPRLALDSYVQDLGRVVAGDARHCRVTLRNPGNAPVQIGRITTPASVQCIGAPTTLAPGDVGEVDFLVRPEHLLDASGRVRTSILRIACDDYIRPLVSLVLRCTAVEPVTLETPVVYFPRVAPGTPGTRVLRLAARLPVEIAAAEVSHPSIEAALREKSRRPSSVDYELQIRATAEDLGPGVYEHRIHLVLTGVDSTGADVIARVRVPSVPR